MLSASYLRHGMATLAFLLCASGHSAEVATSSERQLEADTDALAHLVVKGDTTVAVEAPIRVMVPCAGGLPTLPRRCLSGEAVEYIVPFSVTSEATGVDAVYQFIARYVAVEDRQPDLADFVALPYKVGIMRWGSSQVKRETIYVQTRYWRPGDGHAAPTGNGSVRIQLGASLKYALMTAR